MSFPPLQQLAQEKHHFDKKNDFSSKFNLMKAHGACGETRTANVLIVSNFIFPA